ncbi:hypothetical protein M3Y95_00894300 [Aphelenchoides besseyi]|nr:hypothetical protein M3Y95_00894300 [Aphelenchoides besseyi]
MADSQLRTLELKPDFSQFAHQLDGKEVIVKRSELNAKSNSQMIEIIKAAINNDLPRSHYYSNLAEKIKSRADEVFGASWCCMVGSNFVLNTNTQQQSDYAHYHIGPYIHDVTSCVLSNFFYRWPRNGTFHNLIYSQLTSGFRRDLATAFCVFNYLFYGMFLINLFMSFNIFCTFGLSTNVRTCELNRFWNRTFYKYVLGFLIFPIWFCLPLISADARFRYVQSVNQYFLVVRANMKQYISRETSTKIVGIVWTITMIVLLVSLIRLLLRLCFKHATKLDMDELRNTIICLFYTILHGLFLGYEILTCYFTEMNDFTAVYALGTVFPIISDLITLTPPIFLLLVSVQIRRVVMPTRFFKKRHTIVDADAEIEGIRNTNKICPVPSVDPMKFENINSNHLGHDGKLSPIKELTEELQPTSRSNASTARIDKIEYPALPYGIDWTDHLSAEKRAELLETANVSLIVGDQLDRISDQDPVNSSRIPPDPAPSRY